MKSRFLIAAPSSNSGKTTVTLALLRLLSDSGLKVQPFKCGPDYIDTRHHQTAAGQTSINLDTFMAPAAFVQDTFELYAAQANVSVVEGVMGLFDGAKRMQGSSAEIALLLDIPVILVVQAKAMAYSAAPLLFGFKNFHPGLRIAGVIFNGVSTESHYRFLQEACRDAGVESLGFLPYNESIQIPSRHLGLSMDAAIDFDAIVAKAALHLEKTVNVDRLLELTEIDRLPQVKSHSNISVEPKGWRIAVARDEAFNFVYRQNLDVLAQLGSVTYFSPLKDTELPEADVLYFAGGYPELFLRELSENVQMRLAVSRFCAAGGKVLAECGGMMYLGNAITDSTGKSWEMAGVLDLDTSMAQARLSLGYRIITIAGKEFRGHEFHYSTCTERTPQKTIATVHNARGMEVAAPVYRSGNVVASYIHFYWASQPELFTTIFAE